MALRLFGELAGAELAALELAYEREFKPASEMFIFGSSSATFLTSTAFVATLAGSGNATTTLRSDHVRAAGMYTTGTSTATFGGGSAIIAQFTSEGRALVYLEGGLARFAEFAMEGTSTASFAALGDTVFDMRGSSAVMFLTQTVQHTALTATGESFANLSTQTVNNASLDSFGKAEAELKTGVAQVAEMQSAGVATPLFRASFAQLSTLSSTGAAVATFRGQRYQYGVMSAGGATTVAFTSDPKQYAGTVLLSAGYSSTMFPTQVVHTATLTSTGTAAVGLHGQFAVSAVMNSSGKSTAVFFKGGDVMKTLMRSIDVVERQPENRAVERPYEQRFVEWK